jgi:cell division protein FtsB
MMKKLRWEDAKSYRGAILALVLICVALIVHEIFGAHGYLALRHQKQQYQALQQQIQKLQQDNQKLEEQIKALQSDPHAIEKLAREQMRLARPGEIIYTLPGKDPQKEAPTASAKDTPPK